MSEIILTRKDLVKRDLIEFVISDRFSKKKSKLIMKEFLKIKDYNQIFKILAILNPYSYFYKFSFSFKNILEDSDDMKDMLNNIQMEEIFKNNYLNSDQREELEKYFKLEILIFNFIFDKRFYNSYFLLNFDNYIYSKKKIYHKFNGDISKRYYLAKDTVVIKRGREEKEEKIVKILVLFMRGEELDYGLKKYIEKYFYQEFLFVKYYFVNILNIT